MRLITRSDVTFFISVIGGMLGILIAGGKIIVSLLMTRSEWRKELYALKEFMRTEFVSRKEWEERRRK
jgi:uncharacterized ion transporter superfamily protein YfcC